MAAEKILSTIAANVLSSLGSYAIQHIGLAWGVKGEMRKMETNISTINNILQDAQEQQMSNRAVKEWLERLKLILYDAEDLLDEVATETKRREVESLMRKVHHFFTSSNQLVFRYVVCRKIRDIGKRLDEIVLQMNAFKFVVKLVERPIQINRREETSSFVNTVTVIGRDADKEKLVSLLLSSGDEENVAIIPIVGMGGLGKTTLTQLVYNDHRIQNHFPKRLWVCISNDFDIKRILIKILQADEQHGNINSYKHERLSQLQNRVRNMLSDGNFLLFLDDVWNEDRVEWKKLEDLLITCARGIRIVVTTRSKMVASIVRTSTMEPYELQGLSDNDCLDIFVKWAFKEGDENKHQNLVNIGREIVKKCGGVPLAARTLGALLFSKTNERDWLAVRDSDMRALVQKENDILPILRLSYDQMPSNLKQCFAYCSLFEKDKIIDRKKLLYAWIAQGFVQCLERNEELEHIAESYLEELVRRCFLEPYHASTYFDLGGRERYIMHDLVHDLTQYVAGNEFLTIKGATEAIPDTVRHVSFESNTYCKSPRVLIKAKKLRTIFYPSKTEPAFESCVQLEIASFRCLRVLEGCRSQNNIFLLEQIGKLKLLRYLSLNGVGSLPKSLCELLNLQYLDLSESQVFELPEDFGKLINLRFLCLSTRLTRLPKNEIGRLTSLRTLIIYRCIHLSSLGEGIEHLSCLQELVLDSCDELLSLPTGFSHLTSLEHLEISFCQRLNFSDDDDLKGLRSLRKLRLQALPGLVSLPKGLQDAVDIRELVLDSCDELVSLPASFRHLTSLECLEISFCRRLNFSDDNDLKGLRNLKKLILQALPGLVSLPKGLQEAADTLTQLEILSCWNFTSPSESVLPNLLSLQSLRIWHCHKVQSMPEGMQRLTKLHYLNIFVCYPNPSRYREGGEDWPKIGHVHIIDIF